MQPQKAVHSCFCAAALTSCGARNHRAARVVAGKVRRRGERMMQGLGGTLPLRFTRSLSGAAGQALAAAAIMARMMMVITNCMVVMASSSKLPAAA
jgi:hypothetical protein